MGKLSDHINPPNPMGSCFDSAAFILLKKEMKGYKSIKMCHGICTANYPGQEGNKIAHAWLEAKMHSGIMLAIDPIWMKVIPAGLYRKLLKVEYCVEYNPAEFMRLWVIHDFPGPWDPAIKEKAGTFDYSNISIQASPNESAE